MSEAILVAAGIEAGDDALKALTAMFAAAKAKADANKLAESERQQLMAVMMALASLLSQQTAWIVQRANASGN